MIKTGIDRSSKSPMILFYGMNSIKDLEFHNELELLTTQCSNFNYFPLLSNNDEQWKGDLGYINYDYIKSKTSISSNCHFYFCGSPIMTDKISRAKKERWGIF